MTKVGDIELITSSQDLSSLIERCLKEDAYAIVTEFHREKSYYPKLALIQINFGKGVALVDPTIIAVSPLKELFQSQQVAVMHACAQDLEVFQHYCEATPQKIFDTQIAAGFLGLRTPSLSALHERFLKIFSTSFISFIWYTTNAFSLMNFVSRLFKTQIVW